MSLRDQVAALPPTALVPVGELLEQLDTEPDVPTSVSLVPEPAPSWRDRIWTCGPETRLGVIEPRRTMHIVYLEPDATLAIRREGGRGRREPSTGGQAGSATLTPSARLSGRSWPMPLCGSDRRWR